MENRKREEKLQLQSELNPCTVRETYAEAALTLLDQKRAVPAETAERT